ncbi:MAG: hypothetical protein AAFV98_20735 [Chloroflexota bacterium]
MLETLDTVDWANLTHAYSRTYSGASNIPPLIRGLTSSDEENRKRAYEKLFDCIFHQSTIYEATAYVVPFLIELLQNDSVEAKDDMLHMLNTVQRGMNDTQSYLSWIRSSGQDYTSEDLGRMQKEADAIATVFDNVKSAYGLYLDFLHSPDAKLRWAAVKILDPYIDLQDEIVPAYKRIIEGQEPLDLQQHTLKAINHLRKLSIQRGKNDYVEEHRDYLLTYFRQTDSLGLRYTASIALLNDDDPTVVDEILSFLSEVIRMKYSVREEIGFFMFNITSALRYYQPRRRLPFLIQHKGVSDERSQRDIINALGWLAFDYRWATETCAKELSTFLNSKNERVRKSAAQQIVNLGVFAEPYLDDILSIIDLPVNWRLRELQGNSKWRVSVMIERLNKIDMRLPDLLNWLEESVETRNRDLDDLAYTLSLYGSEAQDAIKWLKQIARKT